MRVSSAISWSLVGALSIASIVLWRDLRAAREEIAEIRAEHERDRLAAAEAVRQLQATAAAAPAPVAAAPAPPQVSPTAPDKAGDAARLADVTARLAEVAQRQSALLAGDPEYRKATFARARNDVETRYPTLARDLGLSEQDATFILDVLAESELRRGGRVSEINASLSAADPSGSRLTRLPEAQDAQQEAAITARLGAARNSEVRDYVETHPSRQRIGNIGGALTQAGVSLSESQSKSLMALLVSEQRRKEGEIRTEGTNSPSRATEREFESNRRILAAVPNFLDPPQVAVIKGRFDRAEAGARATTVIQQRMGAGQ